MSTRLSSLRGGLIHWWISLLPLRSDAVLYGVSCAFALAMGYTSDQAAQWHWGYLAAGPFALAAVVAYVATNGSKSFQTRLRPWLVAATFVGVVAMPLALEIHWRQAQPEVTVIAHGGHDVVVGHLYHWKFKNGHFVKVYAGLPAYESFFPYFPLMTVFGLPSAFTHRESGLTDARIFMSVFTCLLLAVALALLRAPPERLLRIAQVLVVLPTGSLFLATGGDDMPILALCLLSLVALQRHRSLLLGLILGVAAAMKLTAWPFAVAVLALSRHRNGRRAWLRSLGVIVAVSVITITPFALRGPWAFMANVVAFPLGLAGVDSPAASPLPGHVLTSWFPVLRHVLLPAVFVVGGYYLSLYLRRHWPLDISRALRVLAVVMLVVICSATATRLGYVIYPLNFLLWAWVLDPSPRHSRDAVVLVEPHRPAR